MTVYELPNISIDVIPLILNRETNILEILVADRIYDPYLGEPALPGVLLSPHERVGEAGYRALETKTHIPSEQVIRFWHLGAFDNPDRDPRGATVSIALVAVLDAHIKTPSVPGVHRIPLNTIVDGSYPMPFDHTAIVRAAAQFASEKFMSSYGFTHALLSPTFTTKMVRGVLNQFDEMEHLVDFDYDPSNLTRMMKKTRWFTLLADPDPALESAMDAAEREVYATSFSSYTTADSVSLNSYNSTSRGRPSRTWGWSGNNDYEG